MKGGDAGHTMVDGTHGVLGQERSGDGLSERHKKFRRAVLAVQFVCNMIKIYKDYAESQVKTLSFAELTTRAVAKRNKNLLFDLSWYRASRERDISTEVKAILSKHPADRTTDEIKLATLDLRNAVDTFAEYPPAMQYKLASVGWFESFGPGRVIIRQGHVPQNFYLILRGLALVSKRFVDQHTSEVSHNTAAFLKTGRSFGEVAILNGAKRNATVVCHNTVSLLAVSRQDFKDTFVSVADGPEFLDFLRQIKVFQGWPLDRLPTNNTGVCLHTFFRRNTVISKDTRLSPFIFVVKSGTVQLLKQLRAAKTSFSVHPFRKSGWNTQSLANLKKVSTGTTSTQSSRGRSEDWAGPLQRSREEEVQGDSIPADWSFTPPRSPKLWPNSQNKLYISIQTLTEGDVFGLAYLVFEDTCSMTLVSQGAECILITKDFIKKNGDDVYFHSLTKQMSPYPSEMVLQAQLQDHINWEAYKHLVLKDIRR